MARRRRWRLVELTDGGKGAATETRLDYQPPLANVDARLVLG